MAISTWKFDDVIYSSNVITDIDENVNEVNTDGMQYTVAANVFTLKTGSKIQAGGFTAKVTSNEVLNLPLTANAATYYFYLVRNASTKVVTFTFSTTAQSGTWATTKYIELFRYNHPGGTVNLATTNLVIDTKAGSIPLKQYTQKRNIPFGELVLAYSKTDSDARYMGINNAYTKTQSDAKYALINTSYSKSETDAKYILETERVQLQNLDLAMIGYNDNTHKLADIPNLLKAKTLYGISTMRENYLSTGNNPNLKEELRTILGVFGTISNNLELIYESSDQYSDAVNVGNFIVRSQDTAGVFHKYEIPFFNGKTETPINIGGPDARKFDKPLSQCIYTGNYYGTNFTDLNTLIGTPSANVIVSSDYDGDTAGTWRPIQITTPWVFKTEMNIRQGSYIKPDGTPGTQTNAKYEKIFMIGYRTLFSNRSNPLTNTTLNTTAIPNITKFKTIEIYYSPNEGGEKPRWVVMQRRDDGTFEGNMNYNQLGGIKYDITITLAWDAVTNKCIYQLAYLERNEIPNGNTIGSDVVSGTFIYEIIGKEWII
jgi:hypothetical protein